MTVTIYHNPKCSKSRATLALLEERSIEVTVVEYLKTPPSVEELSKILEALGLEPRQVMRKCEAAYEARGLSSEGMSRDTLLEAMAQEPILIERPIVVNGDKARIGRPPELVLEIL